MQRRRWVGTTKWGGGRERWSEVSWGDLDQNNNTLLSCIWYLAPPIVALLCECTLVLRPRPSIEITVDPP
jgi:hypothetical protein